MQSINRLQAPAGRMLCKARLVEGASEPLEVHVEVHNARSACSRNCHGHWWQNACHVVIYENDLWTLWRMLCGGAGASAALILA